MKKLLGKIRDRNGSADELSLPPVGDDSPEANVTRAVKTFCESGGDPNEGDEVAQLPTIVEGAESSPNAAKQASSLLRRYLTKDYAGKAHMQYNAVMLLRILSTNPGPGFTRNLDAKFVATVKDLARYSKDPSVLQILRETLDSFEQNSDEGLTLLKDMWRKERASSNQNYSAQQQRLQSFAAPSGHHPIQSRSNSTPTTLPNPEELAGRIEEARTSAKLLLQVVQSTAPSDLIDNDLIKEFSQRCSQASRSMQKFIHCQNPSPDEDTMLTLIETNDQLAMAMSQHQRAVLQARKEMSRQNSSADVPHQAAASPSPPALQQPLSEPPHQTPPEPIAQKAVPAVEEDPFADKHAESRPQDNYSDLYGSSNFANLAISDTPNLTRERGYSDAYDPPSPAAQRRPAPVSPVSPQENGLQQHPVTPPYPPGGTERTEVSPPSSPQIPQRKPVSSNQFRY